jgi:hypothetical protein
MNVLLREFPWLVILRRHPSGWRQQKVQETVVDVEHGGWMWTMYICTESESQALSMEPYGLPRGPLYYPFIV